MRNLWTLAALALVPAVLSGQATGVLVVRVTLVDAAGTATPVARHSLLVSDNPPTREPRRIVTTGDGTARVTLPPGSYTVESDRPVTFLGRAFLWTENVAVAAGREVTLELTAGNAEAGAAPPPGAGGRDRDAVFPIAPWHRGVVEIWSPTARASGFVIDRRGLIATDRNAIGQAGTVAVQLSAELKVPARVLVSDPSHDAAIVWVQPEVIASAPPVPLRCPPAAAPPLDDRQVIVAIAAPFGRPKDELSGEITALQPRAAETDLRLPFGGAGGPAFNEAGDVVGLTSVREDKDPRRAGGVAVVRVPFICAALSGAEGRMAGGSPPEPAKLPVEPARPYPAEALKEPPPSATDAGDPPLLSSSDFDVAFMTPPMVRRGRLRADWTGGKSTRSPEALARLGRLTEFGNWSDYFVWDPPVLIVRVTPKLVEGFWKRLGREAARTQGAVLPAFKDFNSSFLRMRASCGAAEVAPIQPFVLEHRVSEKNVVREGLYVFGPDALGPHCGTVTLSLYSEKAPSKADTLVVTPQVLDRIQQDFRPFTTPG